MAVWDKETYCNKRQRRGVAATLVGDIEPWRSYQAVLTTVGFEDNNNFLTMTATTTTTTTKSVLNAADAVSQMTPPGGVLVLVVLGPILLLLEGERDLLPFPGNGEAAAGGNGMWWRRLNSGP